jgi:undecaprenyl-diphosphatase
MSSSRTQTWISVVAVALSAAFLLDHAVNDWVRANRTDAWHQAARAVSLLGTGAGLLPVLAILALRGWTLDDRRLLWLAATGAVALLLAGIASPTAKLVFSRIRPHDPGAGVFRLLAFASSDSSFPSGHTMAAFALAGVLAAAAPPRVRVGVYGIATLVPLARVLGGRHFLADVVAGLVAGRLLALAAERLVARWRRGGDAGPRPRGGATDPPSLGRRRIDGRCADA